MANLRGRLARNLRLEFLKADVRAESLDSLRFVPRCTVVTCRRLYARWHAAISFVIRGAKSLIARKAISLGDGTTASSKAII